MPIVNSHQQAMRIATANLRRTLSAVDVGALELVTRGKGELLAYTRSFLSHPGNGRLYPSRRGDGTIHQASAAGQPPAADTGRYRASILTRSGKVGSHRYYLGVGSPEPYARELEYGRTFPTFMAPRPHFEYAMRYWITMRYIPFARDKFVTAQRAAAMGDRITLRTVGYQGSVRGGGVTSQMFKM